MIFCNTVPCEWLFLHITASVRKKIYKSIPEWLHCEAFFKCSDKFQPATYSSAFQRFPFFFLHTTNMKKTFTCTTRHRKY